MYKATNGYGVVRLSDGAYIPADPQNTDYAAYLTWLDAGNTPEPATLPEAPSLEDLVVGTIQLRLDNFAKTRGYDSILSACTYATSKVAKFAAEGQYCVDSRDTHWSTCYTIMGDVQTGARAVPTLDEVIAEMPALEWPQ